MDTDLNQITERIIGCAFKVGNGLGPGFLEKCYENVLAHELKKAGLRIEQQQRIDVLYDGVVVGEYVADMVVAGSIIIELKAIKTCEEIHSAQCINFLAATNFPICLLLSFSRKVEVKRFAGKQHLPF
jgi:GxxExxY protein